MNSNPYTAGDRGTGSDGKVNFQCSDVGPKNCDWTISGNNEAEIMPKIEKHGREAHNMTIDEPTKNKVRSSIHRQAA